MAGRFMALMWALAGGALMAAAYVLLDSNIMFAMMALGLGIACALVAGACLLKPPARRGDRDANEGDDEVPAARRRWGPR